MARDAQRPYAGVGPVGSGWGLPRGVGWRAMLVGRVDPGTTRRADPMPTWKITDHRGRVETVVTDRIKADGNGWSWWTVVLVVNDPRWSCVRRVKAADVVGQPLAST